MDLTDSMVSVVDGPSMVDLYETVVSLYAYDTDGALLKKTYDIFNSMAETETGRVAFKSNLEELMRHKSLCYNHCEACSSVLDLPCCYRS